MLYYYHQLEWSVDQEMGTYGMLIDTDPHLYYEWNRMHIYATGENSSVVDEFV